MASPVDFLPSYERGRGGNSREVGEERLTEHTWLESIGRESSERRQGEWCRVSENEQSLGKKTSLWNWFLLTKA